MTELKLKDKLTSLEQLEEQLKNNFYVPKIQREALVAMIKQLEHIEALQNEIEENKPKVIFAEALEVSKLKK